MAGKKQTNKYIVCLVMNMLEWRRQGVNRAVKEGFSD